MATDIHRATPDEITAIMDFVMSARTDMFPMLDSTSHMQLAKRELVDFQHIYLDHPEGCFLTAWADKRLVATIGYVAYDQRFPQLKFGHDRVVEVVRLYVDPECRRAGLASKLFAALQETARQAGIEQLYLHTHPFLLGAVDFWKRQGFSVINVDDDIIWNTTHMSRLVGE
ncbi:hypothetical protein FZEAL_5340 [Fusarium zealandicum]|uniref:N-acetyltransferase domain-containing protein n=1 Tax=Fusarium zealandicum TaxID=1053134 RepID=A0A8H4XKJ4_9HYPO|nr:hypothetical protein FZEAL_5340 [Fusarium zealandicum]